MIRVVLLSAIPIIIILLILLKIGLNNKDFVEMQKELTKTTIKRSDYHA